MAVTVDQMDLTALSLPFRSIWTYGSDWANARTLVEVGGPEAGWQAPDRDRPDLKFEVQYRTGLGLSYFGVARRRFAGVGLEAFVARLRSAVEGRMPCAEAMDLILQPFGAGCRFVKCVFGIAHAWAENPRYSVPQDMPLTRSGLGTSLACVETTYPDGAGKEIMCELVDPDLGMWIAFQVSTARDGQHRLDPALAERIFSEVMRLPDGGGRRE
jgi:hypothetical protein